MQKRILIVSDNLFDQVNGVVTTFNNIQKQAELNGYTVDIINPSQFKYISAPKYPEVKLSFAFGISKMIDKINPDYIHICTEGPLGVAARDYCRKRKYRYNTSYHTKFPEFIKKIYGIPEWITYKYVCWFHKDSFRVLTTTQTMVNELKSHGFKTDVISWSRGVDRELLQPTVNRTARDKPVLLYAGRVSKEKSLKDLCELSKSGKYYVQIVGDGPYRKHLQKRYPLVEFVGYKSGSDLANYYVNADVFCFPSSTDTFGIVIIEAMSLGCPVAAYPVPGPIDIITPGVDGYMEDNLEIAIEKCLTLDRHGVYLSSNKWTWEHCWEIFKHNLINKITY
jgi:glycosyltransferase involved in cell wall biosynthesis